MKQYFEYLYYRISEFYKASGDKDYLDWGYWILLDSLGCIALAIISTLLYAFHLKLSRQIIITIFALVGFLNVIVVLFVDNKTNMRKYEEI